MTTPTDLAEGRYLVDNCPVTRAEFHVLIFVAGIKRDDVAPWWSVYKIHVLTASDVTFLLTSSGHNAGVVFEPRRDGRTYQVVTRTPAAHYIDPGAWVEPMPRPGGSLVAGMD